MAQSKYVAGSIVSTPKGDVRVLARKSGKRLSSSVKRNPRLVIQVLSTGTVLDIQQGNLLAGKFRDHRACSVYGVGYLGSSIQIPDRGKSTIIRRIYDLWANMLKRAYGNYKSCQGYEDVTVDPRWHNFTNFLSTVSQIPGYAEWENSSVPHMSLDKDIRSKGSRTYSLDTCSFVSLTENTREASRRRWHGSSAPCKHNGRNSKQFTDSGDERTSLGGGQGI